MKQRFSFIMLLVLVLGVLAACSSPTTTTPSPSGSSAAGSSAPSASTVASSSPSSAASASDAGGVVVPSGSASASPSEAASSSASASVSTLATATTDTAVTGGATTTETAAAGGTTATDTAAIGETAVTGATAATGETATSGGGAAAGGAVGAAALPKLNAGINIGTIKIATQGPLSGAQAQFGSTARNGAQIAVQQLGPQMGLTNVSLRAEDDQAIDTVGASRASDLATDQDVMCVVGHINSGVALAALPTYQAANLIMISPANTNPRITDQFTGTGYRVVGRDDVQGVVAADFAVDTLQPKPQTAFVVHDQTPYGEGLATVFRNRAQERGLNVVNFVGTAEKQVFDSVLLQIQAANPDVVFFGGTYDSGGPFLKQLRDRGITAKVIGGDGMDSSTVAQLAGQGAVGLNYVTVSGPASAYPNAAQFVKDYQAAYKVAAGYPAFQGYDSTRACLTAVVDAANAANGRPTRAQVKAAMAEIKPFTGVTGPVSFNKKGDRDPATYFVFEATSADPAQWVNNKVVGQKQQSPPK